jgi:hypothetical protein
VEVRANRIELRLPMQVRERHGIFVGNALSVHVTDNRVIDPAYVPPATAGTPPMPLVECDGIRLWGTFGPMIMVMGNTVIGPSTGVLIFTETPPQAPTMTVQNVRLIPGLNAYIGNGDALRIFP